MSRSYPWLACFMLLVAPSPALADGPKPIVAVFDIQAKQVRLKRSTVRMLSDYLATRLAAAGAYRVIPRSELKKKLVAQKKKSYKLCYDQSCQIDIGKELAAGKSLSTQLMKIGRGCVVTATLYDLRSSTTEKAATARCRCREEDFVGCLDRVVSKISGPATNGGSSRDSSTFDPNLFKGKIPSSGGYSSTSKPRVRGSMDKEVIRRVIRQNLSQVQRCYQEGLGRVPGLRGRVVVEFTIDKTGRVVRSVVKQTTLGDMAVEQCIARQARGWRFPKPTGGGIVIVSYPFVLRTSGTPARAPGGAARRSSLSRTQIRKVMKGLAQAMRLQCYDVHRQAGLISVQLTVLGSGVVSQAVPRGRHGRTPMAACVADVVRGARFPSFGGKPLTITYPFVFR